MNAATKQISSCFKNVYFLQPTLCCAAGEITEWNNFMLPCKTKIKSNHPPASIFLKTLWGGGEGQSKPGSHMPPPRLLRSSLQLNKEQAEWPAEPTTMEIARGTEAAAGMARARDRSGTPGKAPCYISCSSTNGRVSAGFSSPPQHRPESRNLLNQVWWGQAQCALPSCPPGTFNEDKPTDGGAQPSAA